MRIHQESIPDVDRYIANGGSFELADKIPQYEPYLNFAGKVRQVKPGMRILEAGAGTGWFPIRSRAFPSARWGVLTSLIPATTFVCTK